MVCEYIYRFCQENKLHPHQYTLKDKYIKLGYGKNLVFTIEEMAGRICRAYNSFNREVELAFKLMQELKGKETYVLLENDLPDNY